VSRQEAPWLSDAAIVWAHAILRSHQQAFGFPLLAGIGPSRDPRQIAQEMFAADTVLLAHDGGDPAGEPGPCLIYANRAALRLWQRSWTAMVGMPSRLTAAPEERGSRARALSRAHRCASIRDYSGVRIDSRGRRFQIRGARIWTFGQENGEAGRGPGCLAPVGQAASFGDWYWLCGPETSSC
jgi:hypothetical protein